MKIGPKTGILSLVVRYQQIQMENMHIAVIGTGKTGGEVVDLVPSENLVGPFNSSRKPEAGLLREADVAIIFVPGSAVDDIIDEVRASGVPAVWGSTGYEWPENLHRELAREGIKWLRASNFSIGMNIIRKCLSMIGEGSRFLENPSFHIHEIHHTGKKDAPSGTAISWKEWLNIQTEDHEVRITSERKGDIKGIHRLQVTTESETIRLEHEAHNRAVFAKGALWAAEKLVDPELEPGFYDIETIFDRSLTSS